MKRINEDKFVLILSIALVLITAVAFNVRSSEAAYEIEFDYGAEDTGDEFNPPCVEQYDLVSFQTPLSGKEWCEGSVDAVKAVIPETDAPDRCPTPLFLARYVEAPEAGTTECAATTSVISL